MKLILFLKIVCLILAFSIIACAETPSMTITFTKGERSKDSSSTIITIILNGNQLNYTENRSGKYGSKNMVKPLRPINKTFALADEDIKSINDLIRQKQFHEKSDAIEREINSPSSYFNWTLTVNFNNKETTNKIAAKRNDTEIQDSSLYKNADEFMRELFAVIKKYDAAVSYAGFN